MPFIRASLRTGGSTKEIRAIADSIHGAVVNSFQVPAKNRFKVEHQPDAREFSGFRITWIAPSSDRCIFRRARENREASDVKPAFYREGCEPLVEGCRIAIEEGFVVTSTRSAKDWSFGNGMAQLVASLETVFGQSDEDVANKSWCEFHDREINAGPKSIRVVPKLKKRRSNIYYSMDEITHYLSQLTGV